MPPSGREFQVISLPTCRFLRYVCRLPICVLRCAGLDEIGAGGMSPSSSLYLAFYYQPSRQLNLFCHPGARRWVVSGNGLVRKGVVFVFLIFRMGWRGRLGESSSGDCVRARKRLERLMSS